MYGMGRYAGGRTTITLPGLPSIESASVNLTREHADDLQSILRKILGGKTAQVSVTLYEEPTQVMSFNEFGVAQPVWVNLVVTDGNKTIVELLDADAEGRWDAAFDLIDDLAAPATEPAATPVAFLIEVLARLSKISAGGPVVDLKQTSHDRVMAVAIGPDFRGIIGDVDRAGYAAGGPWSDGPGEPAHLF